MLFQLGLVLFAEIQEALETAVAKEGEPGKGRTFRHSRSRLKVYSGGRGREGRGEPPPHHFPDILQDEVGYKTP